MTGKKRKILFAVALFLFCGVIQAGCFLFFSARKRAEFSYTPMPTAAIQGAGTDGNPSLTEAPLPLGTDETDHTGKLLVVHVCGAVSTEGVYQLPLGARGMDAVTAAGGFHEEADRSYLNLAAQLRDGQKLYIPTKAETASLPLFERMAEEPWVEQNEREPQLVNLNTASVEQLMQLPGIGQTKAEEIVRYREKVSHFQQVEDLKKVPGIGDALFLRLCENICVE